MSLYHVLDIETTGLNSDSDEICELAISTVNGTQILDVFHSYYSVTKMNPIAESKHGYSIDLLKGWPYFSTDKNINLLKTKLKYPRARIP